MSQSRASARGSSIGDLSGPALKPMDGAAGSEDRDPVETLRPGLLRRVLRGLISWLGGVETQPTICAAEKTGPWRKLTRFSVQSSNCPVPGAQASCGAHRRKESLVPKS